MSLSCTQIVVSLMMLAALSLERYLKLVHPFVYARTMTTPRVLSVILACAIYAFGFGFLPLLGWNNVNVVAATGEPYTCRFEIVLSGTYLAVLFLGHIMPLFVILPVMHVHVFITAHRVLRRASLNRNFNFQSRSSLSQLRTGSQLRVHTQQRNMRHFKILVVMGLYFILSWMPLSLWEVLLWRGFTKEFVTSHDYIDPPVHIAFFYTALFLAMANSAVNPIIFGAGNSAIRRSLHRCVTCKRQQTTGAQFFIHSMTDTHMQMQMQHLHRASTEPNANAMHQLLEEARPADRRPRAHLVTHGIITAIATTTIQPRPKTSI